MDSGPGAERGAGAVPPEGIRLRVASVWPFTGLAVSFSAIGAITATDPGGLILGLALVALGPLIAWRALHVRYLRVENGSVVVPGLTRDRVIAVGDITRVRVEQNRFNSRSTLHIRRRDGTEAVWVPIDAARPAVRLRRAYEIAHFIAGE